MAAAMVLGPVSAPAAPKLGPVHQIGDSPVWDLRRQHALAGQADGSRVTFDWDVTVSSTWWPTYLLRHHYAADGVEIESPRLLIDESVRAGDGIVTSEPDGTFVASWMSREPCAVSLARFDLAGNRLRHARFEISPSFCEHWGHIVAGSGEQWRIFRFINDDDRNADSYEYIRFDWEGSGSPQQVLLSDRASSQFELTGMGVDSDGTFVTLWEQRIGYDVEIYGRWWSAAGDPLSKPFLLGDGAASQWPPGDPMRRVVPLSPGRMLAGWRSPDGQWLGREIVLGEGHPTTTTTTTTMPAAALPELGPPIERNGYENGHVGEGAHLLAGRSGTLVIASTLQTKSGPGAFVDVSRDDGRTWSGPRLLGHAWDVAAATDGEGNWLVVGGHCPFNDASECLWRFWRSTDDARTWKTGFDLLGDGFGSHYLPRPVLSDFQYARPRLSAAGDGHWYLALSAQQDLQGSDETATWVFVGRSTDDGATWAWGARLEEMLGALHGASPELVATEQGPLTLWKFSTLRGVFPSEVDPRQPASGAHTLTSDFSEFGSLDRWPRGFAAASDARDTVIGLWPARTVRPSGWGWDGDIVFSRSNDSGRTWTEPGPVAERALVDAARDDFPAIATTRRGSWLAAWRTTDPSFAPGLTEPAFAASFSLDDGNSWSPPAPLAPAALAMDPSLQLASLVGRRRAGGDQWAVLWRTERDDGSSSLWLQTSPSASRCGNAFIESSEECDDGNDVEGDGCDSNCTASHCGNGVVATDEECDDGNRFPEDSCSPRCRTTSCGDGVTRWDTEECDDGNDAVSDACLPACVANRCGDGFLHYGVEECDDGNYGSGDGCDRNCRITACGNGHATEGEACDDGNSSNEDYCLNDCSLARCGDGIVRTGGGSCPYWADSCAAEQCDDGNDNPTDGCLNDCMLSHCGDGIVTALEPCDDGNFESGDGCDANCTLTACGNGVTTDGELCDDGNTANGDNCSADCTGFPDGCGDADASGGVNADDAQQVVGSAVGLDVACPRWACDVNGNKAITVVDGSLVLQKAVGIAVATDCNDRVVIRLETPALLGALQLEIDHRVASGTFYETRGQVRCSRLAPGLFAAADTGSVLSLGFVSLAGIQGPVDLAECSFRRFGPPTPNEFAVTVLDASSPDFEPPNAPPWIRVSIE